jgi:hypothetical protein
MQHTLRSAPCAGCVELSHFDALVRSALSKICNISSTDDQWLQASLPVRAGGLGLRRVSSLATPAFIASAVGTLNLQNQILHTEPIAPSLYSDLNFYFQSWHAKYGDIPSAASSSKNEAVRMAVCFRLGIDICEPHPCVCGHLETAHLFQRLSVALQRFNAVCVYDTFAGMSEPDAE